VTRESSALASYVVTSTARLIKTENRTAKARLIRLIRTERRIENFEIEIIRTELIHNFEIRIFISHGISHQLSLHHGGGTCGTQWSIDRGLV
jgi:hypothetical protein